MFLLRVTLDPALHRARTDDDFLLGVTAGHQAPAYRDMVTAPPVRSVYR